MHEEYIPDIPESAEARVVQEYTHTDQGICPKATEYYVDGILVGRREFDEEERMWQEYALDKDGQPHGWYYEFDEETGDLQCKEFYVEGKLHGTCKQWIGSKFVGAYTLEMGNGDDLWRHLNEDGNICLSEIRQYKDGNFHGYVWWVNDDQQSVWSEEHFNEGQPHGIKRQWNIEGKLSRGYPQYYVLGEKVDKRKYLRLAVKDQSLPSFRVEDQSPQRSFTAAIQEVMKEDNKRSKNLTLYSLLFVCVRQPSTVTLVASLFYLHSPYCP